MLVSYICGVFLLTSVWSAEATTSVKKLNVDIGLEPNCRADEKFLYCTVSNEEKLYRLTLDTNKVDSADAQCGSPNVIIPSKDFIVVTYGRLIYIGEFGADGKFVTALDIWKPDNYIDFCIGDSIGFIWCVTKSPTNITQSAYRVKEKVTELTIKPYVYESCFAFSPDDKYVYFIDSKNGIIYVFSFNVATGEIFNQKVFFVIGSLSNKIVGKANYIVVDIKGNIYLSVGNVIVVISRFGKFVTILKLSPEVKTLISLAFGGDKLTTLYASCTTAKGGAVYAIDGLDTRGIQRELDFDEAYYRTSIQIN